MNSSTNSNYLIITAIGENNPRLISVITENIKKCGCNIINSKINTLGKETIVTLLICGNWNAIAKIEAKLPGLEKKLKLSIFQKRTSIPQIKNKLLYTIHAVTLDKPGIINSLTNFFIENDISIDCISSHSYQTFNHISMLELNMNVQIPIKLHIPSLREQFIILCDQLSIDASFEALNFQFY